MQTEKQKERISQNKVQDSTGKKGHTVRSDRHHDKTHRHTNEAQVKAIRENAKPRVQF